MINAFVEYIPVRLCSSSSPLSRIWRGFNQQDGGLVVVAFTDISCLIAGLARRLTGSADRNIDRYMRR